MGNHLLAISSAPLLYRAKRVEGPAQELGRFGGSSISKPSACQRDNPGIELPEVKDYPDDDG
jgi:hypothetical protein